MTHFADLASWALGLVRSTTFLFVLLPILAWSLLSFVVAVALGRAIRRADEREGVFDELDAPAAPALRVAEFDWKGLEESLSAQNPDRREPTRSGPFVIDSAAQANLRKHLTKKSG